MWGAPAEPRLGCLCLHLPDRRPLDALTGRWESGIFASGFADLNLRLAEMLGDLHMPAVLLASVLPPATADLIDTAVNRGPDDRRGLVEFVQGLQLDRMELYLALLTTDGPLVAARRNAGARGRPNRPENGGLSMKPCASRRVPSLRWLR